MTSTIQDWVRGVYSPPRLKRPIGRFEPIPGAAAALYTPYGRSALYLALKSQGIGEGDRVLIPGLICRDVLSAITTLGARPLFYAVDSQLQLSTAPEDLPPAKACILVNYFGFPQDMGPFEAYRRCQGAFLIEDNAHGLFSADTSGRLLGSRAPMGIFSFRKTVPVLNGAALVINDLALRDSIRRFTDAPSDLSVFSFAIKNQLRKVVACVGPLPVQLVSPMVRHLRPLVNGEDDSPELQLPAEKSIYRHLQDVLCHVDIPSEIQRRRSLYMWLHDRLSTLPIQPIFPSLPPHVAPFVYPFYTTASKIAEVKTVLASYGLECFSWPDLPKSVIDQAPPHYQQIWAVRFLW